MLATVLGVNFIDWAVIGVYLMVIMSIGIWSIKKVKSSSSFFIGDRKFGKVLMFFFNFGTGTHSDQAVSVAAKTYNSGASGIWYQWLYLFATPFYWIAAPVFRRMRSVTTSDYFEKRYSPSVSVLYAFVGILQLLWVIAVMLKGSSAMITAVSGGSIDPNIAIIVMTVMFVVYGMAGGMSAAIFTDFIQGVLTIVLSFMLLPVVMNHVGGLAGLHEKIADPGMMKIVAPDEINLFYIAVIALNGLIGWPTQPHTLANCAAGKTEMEGRVGVTLGMFSKRICTIAWMLTGLCAVAIYTEKDKIDVDHVYGLMAYDFLPKIGPGLIGLFIACMLASVMSSCDAFMVVSSGLFTQNIYKRFIGTGKPDKHYILVGRISSIVIVLLSVYFAFVLDNVIQGLEIFWQISAIMGIVFWMGLFWRRVTTAGAWAGTITSLVFFLLSNSSHIIEYLPSFMIYKNKIYLPYKMLLYLGSGLTALIIVSLKTKRPDKQQLDQFYDCLRTPVGKDEPETEPFTLPEGIEPGPRNSIIKHPDFELPYPTLTGMAGFIGSWIAVGLLIGFVYWILSPA